MKLQYQLSGTKSGTRKGSTLLPLREMAISFGLIEEKPKSIRTDTHERTDDLPENIPPKGVSSSDFIAIFTMSYEVFCLFIFTTLR